MSELERLRKERKALEEKAMVIEEKKKIIEDRKRLKKLEKELHPTKLSKFKKALISVERGLVVGGRLTAKGISKAEKVRKQIHRENEMRRRRRKALSRVS